MFAFTKISETGCSHQINARIFLGLVEIVKLTDLSKDEKEQITHLLYELTRDLIKAENAALIIVNEMQEIEKTIESQLKTRNFKSVLSLEDQSRIYLKFTKCALYRVVQILMILIIRTKLKKENLSEIAGHLRRKDQLTETEQQVLCILETYEAWYTNLLQLRDADEHSDANHTLLKNYHFITNENTGFLERPQFLKRKKDKLPHEIPVYEFLIASLSYSLPFCEGLIINSLFEHLPEILTITEIPEEERDIQCPKRFKIVLNEPL